MHDIYIEYTYINVKVTEKKKGKKVIQNQLPECRRQCGWMLGILSTLSHSLHNNPIKCKYFLQKKKENEA